MDKVRQVVVWGLSECTSQERQEGESSKHLLHLFLAIDYKTISIVIITGFDMLVDLVLFTHFTFPAQNMVLWRKLILYNTNVSNCGVIHLKVVT